MIRLSALLFAPLLLTASLVSAAPPSQTATPATPAGGIEAVTSPATPAATSPGCDKAESLPFLAPAASARSATCGTCSEAVCAGYPVGTVCAVKVGVIYRCQDVYGGTCGGSPITLICNCWNGPLP